MTKIENLALPSPYDILLDPDKIPSDFSAAAIIRDEILGDPGLSPEEKERLYQELIDRWKRKQS